MALLTADQEVSLARRIERHDLPAKRQLVEANLRLVVAIAKQYTGRGRRPARPNPGGQPRTHPAVEKFDYRRGNKFHLRTVIEAISRATADQGRTIRLPVHISDKLSSLWRTQRYLNVELGREPSPEEIAAEMGTTTQKVNQLLKLGQEPTSLEKPVGEEEDSRLGEFIVDEQAVEPLEAVSMALTKEALAEALDVLTTREREIITLRFGLGSDCPHTLDEVGRRFGITRERIRQIEQKTLVKLRSYRQCRALQETLD